MLSRFFLNILSSSNQHIEGMRIEIAIALVGTLIFVVMQRFIQNGLKLVQIITEFAAAHGIKKLFLSGVDKVLAKIHLIFSLTGGVSQILL